MQFSIFTQIILYVLSSHDLVVKAVSPHLINLGLTFCCDPPIMVALWMWWASKLVVWSDCSIVQTSWCLTCANVYIVICVCLTDFSKLFHLLGGLDGTSDECCTCIRTVIHEAERFKRHVLAAKLRDFLQQTLSAPVRRLSAVASVAASSTALSPLTSAPPRTSPGSATVTVNCNHQPDAV